MRRLSIFLAITAALLACDDDNTGPSDSDFAVFRDPSSSFSTTDVRDIDNEIVRFLPADNTMLWTPGNLLFDNWPVSGNFLGPNRAFEVRFGTVSGERRAYFTEVGPGTICDLRVTGNNLQLLPTTTLPPQ
jgi:hypothetical protein